MTPNRWQHYAGIFLLSLATLLLELALTRTLSVALWYHFGFLIISTALLGFGVSGVLLTIWRRLREQVSLDCTLAILAMLFSLSSVTCFWLMQRIPFDPFDLLSDRRQFFFMPLYYLMVSVPFFCSGLALALLFTRCTRQINRLYAFDLFGAGLGCGAVAIVMPAFGGSGSIVVAASIGLLAATVFAMSKAPKLAYTCLVFCVASVALAPHAARVLPISVTPMKVLSQHSQPIYTAWNTFSRIDVYQRPPNPRPGAPSFRQILFDAGTAATGIQDLRPGVREYLSRHTDDEDYPSGIAYIGKSRPKLLIIGSGGGQQVLDALHFGAREITAVEINPIVNDVVSHRMNDYWGGLFQQPEVHMVTDEGRSFIRRSQERYDAIISVHTISNAAIASGALSLAENYIFTREAFEDYLNHLTPDGVLYFTRPESDIPRLFAIAREAMTKLGIGDVGAHLYAYRFPPLSSQKSFYGVSRLAFQAGFLLKKSPFSSEELNGINALLGVGLPPRNPNGSAPEVLYSPVDPHPGSIYQTLTTRPDLQTVYRTNPSQIEPPTDDHPFFNHTTRWSSINLQTLGNLFTQQRIGVFFLGAPVAEVMLLVLLIQTVLIAAVLILLPLARFSREGLQARNRWRFLLYFAALGFGFITIEITLLSHFSLFLGEPVYTFAVVLASLLLFTGTGAYFAGRFRAQPRRSLFWILPLILITLFGTALAIPMLFRAALGLSLVFRVGLAVVLLAPLGIMLGMPFPTGLRVISEEASAIVPWAWGVNGFFTVIGTVAAEILGMTFGFTAVLLIGASCYLIALTAIGPRMRSSHIA